MRALYLLRKDLRAESNPIFELLVQSGYTGIVLYVEDPRDPLLASRGKQLRDALLHRMVKAVGPVIHYERGMTEQIIGEYIKRYQIDHLVFQRQYEPWEVQITQRLKSLGVLVDELDHYLLVPPERVAKKDGTIYRVFKPYYERWLSKSSSVRTTYAMSDLHLERVNDTGPPEADFGPLEVVPEMFFETQIQTYESDRDFPSREGTSKLSAWLNQGAISIGDILDRAHGEEAFIRQLAWREYYVQWLFRYPNGMTENFKPLKIDWSDNLEGFEAWKRGETGYELVDAAMVQLEEEGWINGRLRMVCASFLVKNLHVDWRLGERYFYEKLMDADLALNTGNWQWIAGTGAVSQPAFRALSPIRQQMRFDPDRAYIRKYLRRRVEPIVDLQDSSRQYYEMYKAGRLK